MQKYPESPFFVKLVVDQEPKERTCIPFERLPCDTMTQFLDRCWDKEGVCRLPWKNGLSETEFVMANQDWKDYRDGWTGRERTTYNWQRHNWCTVIFLQNRTDALTPSGQRGEQDKWQRSVGQLIIGSRRGINNGCIGENAIHFVKSCLPADEKDDEDGRHKRHHSASGQYKKTGTTASGQPFVSKTDHTIRKTYNVAALARCDMNMVMGWFKDNTEYSFEEVNQILGELGPHIQD